MTAFRTRGPAGAIKTASYILQAGSSAGTIARFN